MGGQDESDEFSSANLLMQIPYLIISRKSGRLRGNYELFYGDYDQPPAPDSLL